jgi:hypothetical protein
MSKLAKNDFHAISFVHPGVEVGRTKFILCVQHKTFIASTKNSTSIAADALPLSLSLTHSLASLAFSILFFFSFRALPDNVFRRGTK